MGDKSTFKILIYLTFVNQLICFILSVCSFFYSAYLTDSKWFLMGLFLLTNSYYYYYLSVGFRRQLGLNIKNSVRDVLKSVGRRRRREILRNAYKLRAK